MISRTSDSFASLTIVVFGATGDLYQNKLSLALFNLFSLGFLPSRFMVVGFARKPLSDAEFREFTKDAIIKNSHKKNLSYQEENINDFLNHLKYRQGDLEDVESFKILSHGMSEEDERHGLCANKLFYLAVPPSLYEVIFKNICNAGLALPCKAGVDDRNNAWTRVLVEKPFGKDIVEASRLDKMLGELFDESQIFRIDHYLAKKTLQDILSFRFSDGTLEDEWNNKYIKKIKIIFHEENTLQNRGSFYDGIGALRDVGQNHMLQMLTLVAMENPVEMSTDKIRDARREVLEKTFLLSSEKIVRGQYEGYLEEANVKPDSKTETFFRVSLGIDTKRWSGVPFELEAGKALHKGEVLIEVHFKDTRIPHVFNISSKPGALYDAYEKVLHDCILGDQTIFTTTGEIMAEWRVIEDIIKKWEKTPLVIYKKGSTGAEIN